jgi:hypothetical protein
MTPRRTEADSTPEREADHHLWSIANQERRRDGQAHPVTSRQSRRSLRGSLVPSDFLLFLFLIVIFVIIEVVELVVVEFLIVEVLVVELVVVEFLIVEVFVVEVIIIIIIIIIIIEIFILVRCRKRYGRKGSDEPRRQLLGLGKPWQHQLGATGHLGILVYG